MAKLRFRTAMSLDGFVAGPNQSVDNPLGVGGTRLHEWAFALKAFREMHGMTGGEVNESSKIIEEAFVNVGATVMGRNMFGGHPGPWDPAKPWNGWWGSNPPYHHPVFVVTHHAREPLKMEGGNRFIFVTDGIQAALRQAHQVAEGKDVSLGGGASVARQCLMAGRIDEMLIHLVPTLLGSGERLFDGAGDDLRGLEWVQTIAAPGVTHLKFART
jgi:dihydrofolate reductase